MNYLNDTVRWRFWTVVLLTQLENIVIFLELFLFLYVADYVLNPETPESELWIVKSRQASIAIVAVCYVLPYVLLHAAKYMRASIGHVGGNSRKTLQAALLRMFLDYDQRSRMMFDDADIVMCATRDVHQLVAKGFKGILKLVQTGGRLAAVFLFVVLHP